jgi:hypothetical protein
MKHILILIGVLLAGCSTFTDYPDQTAKAREAFSQGKFDPAYDQLKEGTESDLDQVCYVLERGMIAHVAGQYARSNKSFETALALFEKYEEDRAAAEATEETTSVLLNEKTIPYKGEMFEKTLIHVFWGINYLGQGRDQKHLDEANVEIRRANERLREIREEFEEEFEEAKGQTQADSGGQSIDTSHAIGEVTKEIEAQRQEQAKGLRTVENVYDVSFAHYLSALIYEEQADRGFSYELDNARISYERVHSIYPEFPLIGEDLLRISKKLNDPEAYKKWVAAFGKEWEPREKLGEIVVLCACGHSPQKESMEIRFPVFIPGLMSSPLDAVYGKIAIPKFVPRPTPDEYVGLLVDETEVARSYVLTDVEATSVQFLWDRMTVFGIKQAIRVTVKTAAQVIARKQAEAVGGGGKKGFLTSLGVGIAGAVATEVTEQADLRSWLTLPRDLQILRVRVPAGEHDLEIAAHGAGGTTVGTGKIGKVTVPEGGRIFVNARSIGANVFAQVTGGEP